MTRTFFLVAFAVMFCGAAYGQSEPSTNALAIEESMSMQATMLSVGPAEVTSKSIEDRRFKPPSDAVGVLGPDMFGDQTDHNTGSTSFSVTDIDVPGNSGLPVRLKRKMRVAIYDFDAVVPLGRGPLNSAGWEIDVPHISGIFPSAWGTLPSSNPATAGAPFGWVADGSSPLARCSSGSGRPPSLESLVVNGSPPHVYWSGVKISVPGGTLGDLLLAQSGTQNAATPARWVTKDHWLVSCLTSIINGSGEGFLATAPDGTKYTFNRMIVTGGFPRYTKMFANWFEGANQSQNAYVFRNKYHLVATKVEDRFGNIVNYNYDANNRLTSITASDGRSIILARNTNGTIASATAHGRVWSYAYGSNGKLSTVTLPDGRLWNYAESGYRFRGGIEDKETGATPYSGEMCFNGICTIASDNQYSGVNHESSLTITHPSGAVGAFSFRAHEFFNPWELNGNPEEDKPLNYVDSLVSKSITAAGMLSPQTWAYQYEIVDASLTNVSCQQGLCPDSRVTNVVQPDGRILRFAFRLSGHPAGRDQLLSETTFKDAVQVSKTSYENVVPDSTAGFPTFVGINPVGYNGLSAGFTIRTTSSIAPSEYDLPLKRKHVEQDGLSHTYLVNTFDWLGRAVDVTRSNSAGYSKTEQSVYSDDTSQWVLGLLTSVTDAATGQVEQAMTYHPASRLIATKSQFGQLVGSFTWNANGTLATAKDGKNNTTTLSSYKAGNPQRVDFADGSFETGVFNDFGWLTSMTNARGYITGFGYDPMGRLSSITPPAGDAVVWAGTTLSFTPLTAATYGVPAGGWKHAISRGNYRKETYLDALYRPLVIREYDNADVAGTERFTVKAYDSLNREVFSSYPGKSANLTVGVHTEYDALGRVTATQADSELGVLTTTTEYLSGGAVRVTGPDGSVTTRSFRSLDAPGYEQMVQEVAPGGVTTSISRDVFGKPLTITRSGSDGLSISKQFAYDAAQRLCMRTEPETGTSIIDYDAAGNVLWAANGQAVANPAVCDRAAAVAGAKIVYSYDALNRITGTDVPGSTNDPTVSYLPDGAVNTLSNGTATWTYTYNKLGKPVTESLNLGGKISTLTHAYDTLANEASLTYPNGTVVNYAPNALGQATQVGTYATGLSYRASGFMSAMTYGNGATYSAQPNLRGLPARRLDSKGSVVIADELMAYDQDANPVCVRDSSTGNPGHRDFSYDARDRLIKVSAPNQGWISAEYQYDSQDNIQMARLGTRQYNYSYSGLNRLSEIGQPGTAPVATNYGLLSCSDYALVADLGAGSGGTGGGTGGGGTGGTLVLSPGTLADGMVDEPYSQTLSTTGGTAPYTYALTSGNLGLGLSLSGNTISGTPKHEAGFTFTITSTDSLGATGSQAYSLEILPGWGGGGNEPLRAFEPLAGEGMMALAAGDTLTYAFSHDAQGRMTAKGAQAYVFDALNRMTQVTGKESYLYDGHGRRVQVTKTSDSKKNYPLYGLDGKLLVEDNRQTLKRTEYIYANGRLIAKRIQPITAAGANNGTATVTYIHTDFLGSPVAESNSTGTVTRIERYTPYGEPADMQLDVGPGFTGHATDVATGLTYMQQRYYDADIGRFISPDPVAANPNSGAMFNRYVYANNNPYRFKDPDGRKCTTTNGKPACTFDEFKNGKGETITREAALGGKLSQRFGQGSRILRAEAGMTAKYTDAKALAAKNGEVTIKGNSALGIPDQNVSGAAIVGRMESVTAIALAGASPKDVAATATTPGARHDGGVPTTSDGSPSNGPMRVWRNGEGTDVARLFGHEILHTLYDGSGLSNRGWANPDFNYQHQGSFEEASNGIE